jgi:tetratricopeptide (TPR) repeat protein
MPAFNLVFISCLLLVFGNIRLQAWDLVDTHPDSPEFKQRFLGTYGINSAIEPTLKAQDRPLYASIQPHLESQPELAIELAKKGLTETSSPAFDFLIGSLYYTLQLYPEAREYLLQALKKFPDFRRAHRNLALLYVQDAQYPQAIRHLLRVVELGGGDGMSYSLLGYAYLMQEKYQSALSAYQMARIFLPDSRDVRKGEAQCLLVTQAYGPAIALFDELLMESPTEQGLWLFQANGYLAQEQLQDAIANLEIAHTIAEPTAASLSLLGDLYLQHEVLSPALKNYQQAIQKDPLMRPEQALKPLRNLIQRSHYAPAAAYLTSLDTHLKSDLSPHHLRAKDVLQARLFIESEQVDAGLALLESVLKADPLDGDALLLRARIELDRTDYEAAQFYFERVAFIPKFQVEGLIGLARTAVAQERYQAAIQHLHKSQMLQKRADVARFMQSIERVLSAQP